MSFKSYLLLGFFWGLISLAACSPAPAPSISTPTTQLPPTAPATPAITPTGEAVPTPGALALSDQPYRSPSGSFSIIFPLGWNCQETDLYQIDCFSAEEDASISVRATATGYELLQEHFESLVGAEMVYAYGSKRAFSEESYGVAEGQISIDATWRDEGIFWFSRDHFFRQGPGVLHVSMRALQERHDEYLPLFEHVGQSVEFEGDTLSAAPLYLQRQAFTARDGLFSIEVPTAWIPYGGPLSVEQTYVEGFLSPDLRAQVQVAVYRRDSLLEQQDRIALTQDIMRALYGADMRYSLYSALPDGRERGEWFAERRGVSGITYNGTYRNYLYLFSVVWDETGYHLYLPVLQQVMDSFSR